MTPLQLRKQLLLAESDLNRAQLAGDLAAINAGVRSLADRAKSFGAIASSVAALVASLAAFQRGKPAAPGAAKHSWLQSLLKNAGLISNLWLAFRSQGRADDES